MKKTITAFTIFAFLGASSASAVECPKKGYKPTYCEKAAPKVGRKLQNLRGQPLPGKKRYEDSPLYIIPSFLGMLLATTGDLAEDVVSGTYKGVKNGTALTGAALHDGVESLLPDFD